MTCNGEAIVAGKNVLTLSNEVQRMAVRKGNVVIHMGSGIIKSLACDDNSIYIAGIFPENRLSFGILDHILYKTAAEGMKTNVFVIKSPLSTLYNHSTWFWERVYSTNRAWAQTRAFDLKLATSHEGLILWGTDVVQSVNGTVACVSGSTCVAFMNQDGRVISSFASLAHDFAINHVVADMHANSCYMAGTFQRDSSDIGPGFSYTSNSQGGRIIDYVAQFNMTSGRFLTTETWNGVIIKSLCGNYANGRIEGAYALATVGNAQTIYNHTFSKWNNLILGFDSHTGSARVVQQLSFTPMFVASDLQGGLFSAGYSYSRGKTYILHFNSSGAVTGSVTISNTGGPMIRPMRLAYDSITSVLHASIEIDASGSVACSTFSGNCAVCQDYDGCYYLANYNLTWT